MSEFFITACSFAAPFVSDESQRYIEAPTARAALDAFAVTYSHPCGLYAAEAWESADAYHKRQGPAARWLSNHEQAKQKVTEVAAGSYSYLDKGPGEFEVNGARVTVEDPKGGSVVS